MQQLPPEQLSLFGQTYPHPQSGTARQPVVQAVVKRLTDCPLGQHIWKPLLVKGERMCTICRIRAYCPICMPHVPKDARIAYCQQHAEGRD
ncbi:MAG TPA: hypothetical protein VFU49_22910 [Ktedonobacteraceae bacterium]|nr:hypothetical protein [Ktedonobacteraceae bacterium]